MPNNRTIDKQLGHNLREARKLAGFSQKDFGEATGVCAQQISKFEAGTNRISSSQLVGFAKALGCNVADLLGGIGDFLPAAGAASREDLNMVKNYKSLSEPVRESVRVLVAAMVREIVERHEI